MCLLQDQHGRREEIADRATAVITHSTDNKKKGEQSNIMVEDDQQHVLLMLKGIVAYQLLTFYHSLRDDKVMAGKVAALQPYTFGVSETRREIEKVVDQYKAQLKKQGLREMKYEDINLTTNEISASLVSTTYAGLNETLEDYHLFHKKYKVPLEFDCAVYLLEMKIDYTSLAISHKTYFDEKYLDDKDESQSLFKDGIEDLFSHVNIVLKILQEIPQNSYIASR